jgi:hypothetical protein
VTIEGPNGRGKRLWFDFALLGTTIIWGSAFATQRKAVLRSL